MDIPVNAAKPGRRRYLTLVMIFITVVICYVDRANLAVASAHIQEEFGITKAQMGYVFSAFAWLYTLCQIPGGIGIIWSLIWFKVYQPPRLTKGISKAELDYIRDGGGLVDGDAPVKKEARQPLTAKDWKLVFHRKLIGVYLGQFAVASTLWFFLTWFPNYLTQEKGITALKAGFMTTVPFLAAFVGVLLSGWVADLLVRKGFSLGFARKTPIICGLLISTCIMGANYTNDPMMIMCLMALAFFGNGFASITWSLVSSLAPMRLIGLTGGVFNFAGGLGGITVPLVVGYLAQGYGFAPALVYISAVALIGALSYILLVGDVKRVG